MLDDPIVEEVRKIRDDYAKKFDYDLNAIFADLKKQQESGGRKLVSFPPRKPVVIQTVRQPAQASIADKKGNYDGGKNN